MKLLIRQQVALKWHLPQACHGIRCASSSTRASPRVDLQSIDAKWRARWDSTRRSRPVSPSLSCRKNAYILSMFPYPSGTLHMGHLRVYTISDVLARFKHMKGYNVLHPMGWDAFGLPAENAAIERGIDPGEWTRSNIARMKEQLIAMNAGFDWDREFMTCDPFFYKHTQRIFLELHKKGLAYRAEALVNYDPVDKTVLANEQVDANGHSWRSGAKVQKIMLKQWFFRITAFKEALLKDLDLLGKDHSWPENVLSMQRHWLGKSRGARIRFQVSDGQRSHEDVEVFTTRPDTLFGAQYLALSTTHPIVQRLAKDSSELRDFLAQASVLEPDSKVGFQLPNMVAENPVAHLLGNRRRDADEVPVFVAPYVLGDYGEGAVMGVPGHDVRDMAFWRQQGQSPPLFVVDPSTSRQAAANDGLEAFTQPGILNARCGPYSGMNSAEASQKLVSDLHDQGGLATATDNWRLRDWLVSRQRYWGTPIPIVHCAACGSIPVPEDQLPVTLPSLDDKVLKDKPGNPLDHISSWVNTTCPQCRSPAKRDTDTMDTFVDSSWYYMRFPDAHNDEQPFSQQSVESNLPVNIYVGGVEHAILHLLYSRFIYKFLATTDLSPKTTAWEAVEPFQKLISQGMVHGKTYSDPLTGRFLHPSEVSETDSTEIIKSTGTQPTVSWEKMSKSKHNGVDLTSCVQNYGADAIRAHILFSAPVSEILDWDEEKIIGIQRWFQRTLRLVNSVHDLFTDASVPADIINRSDLSALLQLDSLSEIEVETFLTTNSSILSVTETMDRNPYVLNTAVSDLIKLTNKLITQEFAAKNPSPFADSNVSHRLAYVCLSALLRMMAPIAPAFAEECWEQLHEGLLDNTDNQYDNQGQAACGSVPSIFDTPFPIPLADLKTVARVEASRQLMTCTVQINGKLRFTIRIPTWRSSPNAGGDQSIEEYLVNQILDTSEGKTWLREKNDWSKRKRVIVVGNGKLVNIVF